MRGYALAQRPRERGRSVLQALCGVPGSQSGCRSEVYNLYPDSGLHWLFVTCRVARYVRLRVCGSDLMWMWALHRGRGGAPLALDDTAVSRSLLPRANACMAVRMCPSFVSQGVVLPGRVLPAHMITDRKSLTQACTHTHTHTVHAVCPRTMARTITMIHKSQANQAHTLFHSCVR